MECYLLLTSKLHEKRNSKFYFIFRFFFSSILVFVFFLLVLLCFHLLGFELFLLSVTMTKKHQIGLVTAFFFLFKFNKISIACNVQATIILSGSIRFFYQSMCSFFSAVCLFFVAFAKRVFSSIFVLVGWSVMSCLCRITCR